MPLLSAFTPLGQLTLSSKPSHGERFYEMLTASLGGSTTPTGGSYDLSQGTRAEATCYAQAMRMAHVRYLLEHAGKQIDPDCLDEMLADREHEYGIVPGPNDTPAKRRAAVKARKLLSRGARREAVEDALRTLLGAAFVAYRTTRPAEILNWPTSLGDQPQNLQLPTVPRKLVRITDPISIELGHPQAVDYTPVDPSTATLLVGDTVVVEPEILGITETVLVSAVSAGSFTATFNKPHSGGCLATTQPYPLWTGTQRASLILVSALLAIDPETRRKVDELMQRIARGVSTWCVVQDLGGGTAGPFILDVSPMDATPFDAITTP